MTLAVQTRKQRDLDANSALLELGVQREGELVHKSLGGRVEVVERIAAGHDSRRGGDVNDGASSSLYHTGDTHLRDHGGDLAVQVDDGLQTVLRKLRKVHGVLIGNAHIVDLLLMER